MTTIKKKKMNIKKVAVMYVSFVVKRDIDLKTVMKEKRRKEKLKCGKGCRRRFAQIRN